MLFDKIRSASKSIIFKIFLGLIAISFGIWGIEDIFRKSKNSYVAKIGGSTIITFAEFNDIINKEASKLQKMLGKNFSSEQIKALGLEQIVLNQLINTRLIELECNELGIKVSDEVVAEYIKHQPAFQDKGVFSKEQFKHILKINHIPEAEYIQSLKREIATKYLLNSLTATHISFPLLVNNIYAYKTEKRLAEIYKINRSLISLSTPNDKDLKNYYEEHKGEFSTQELRDLSYTIISSNEFKENATISEEELKKEYDESLSEYQIPELRSIYNLIFTDENKAKEVASKLKNNESIKNVILNDIKNATEEELLLKDVSKNSLPNELKEIAFELNKEGVSDPVQTSFGWHVIKVKAIKPSKTIKYEEVKNKLKETVRNKKQEATLITKIKAIEDELASGATLTEVADKFNLKITKVPTINDKGLSITGETSKEIPNIETFVTTAFSTEEGTESPLMLSPDNSNYFIVRVDKITPSRTLAFEEAKEKVIQAWEISETNNVMNKLAEDTVRKLKDNITINPNIIKATEQVKRLTSQFASNNESNLPISLINELFLIKKGEITSSHKDKDGEHLIAIVKDIIHPTPEKDKDEMKQIKEEVENSSLQDLSEQYLTYLRMKHGVTVTNFLEDNQIEE
jgi:peptidyl-prolyl cis-trans isomerase D